MKIVIMCAGKGDRFGLTKKPKCFSKIQGIPNICKLYTNKNNDKDRM